MAAEPVLQLTHRHPVAGGKWRLVYEHPDGSGRLVKVPRTETIERVAAAAPPGLRRLHRYYFREVELRRELAEYRRARAWSREDQCFLQAFHGLSDTDLGPGLVVGAVRAVSGELAPTLDDLIAAGAEPAGWLPQLEDFLDWFVRSPLRVKDFRPKNLVHDESAGRFVLVDGLGDRTVLPFRAWSARLSRLDKERAARSLSRAVSRALGRRAASAGAERDGATEARPA